MSSFSSSSGIQTIVIQGAQSPLITNVLISEADTEVTIVLPEGCKKYMLKGRESQSLKIAFQAGESGTNYFTLAPGCVYSEQDLQIVTTQTINIQSPVGGQVVELLTWT